MADQKGAYRQVLKATSLFGGVQVVNIVLAIVRSKVIALLIGPEGMGIASLFNATLRMVSGFTNLGLERSSVKELAYVRERQDEEAASRLVAILLKLVWVTGLAGGLVMAVASPWLSQWAFDSPDYVWGFVWLGLAVLFRQLTAGNLAVLQGFRRLKWLANANVIGNTVGLGLTLPLYYFLGLEGIVPAIIGSALVSLLVTYYFSRRIPRSNDTIGLKTAFKDGRPMIDLGVMLSLSSMITLAVAYLVQVYVSQTGGVDEVGFYNAGFVILNTYVGLIFSAMATDYFPRLSAVVDQRSTMTQTVHQQASVAVLLIGPVVVLFLAGAPFFIELLYSGEFTPVLPLVRWGILGMVLKAVSWSMGYIILAKGDSAVFIRTAIGFNLLLLAANMVGYRLGGLEGMGISFLVYYGCHLLGLGLITAWRYGFRLNMAFVKVFVVVAGLCTAAFLMSGMESIAWKYGSLSLAVLLSCVFSWYQLNRRMDLADWLSRRSNRKNSSEDEN
jgi:O-antigen/teichoic acid export membrane protein